MYDGREDVASNLNCELEQAETPLKPQTVRRRRVYFVPGFDPRGPRRIFSLYREESQKQAAISGYEIDVTRMKYERGAHAAHWRAEMRADDRESEVEFIMLRWEDIATRWMRRSLLSTYRLMAVTLWRFTASGAFRALCRIDVLSTFIGIYPVAMMLLYLIIASGVAALTVWAGGLITGLAGIWFAPLAAIAFAGVFRLTRLVDEWTFVYYLMCDFGFTASHSMGEAPEIEDRIDRFADRIYQDWLLGDCDELLVVGHSSGSSHAASAVARLIGLGADGRKGPHISFLTIGQTIPMLSFLPGAQRMRDELQILGQSEAIDWIDVSTPADAISYWLTDAVSVSGQRKSGAERVNPRVYSAKFWTAISPKMEATLRRRYFRIHFQYLCAFDRPEDYDFFRITAGSLKLSQYYEDRRESPQMKDKVSIQRRLRV
jgi:hypothetical protein